MRLGMVFSANTMTVAVGIRAGSATNLVGMYVRQGVKIVWLDDISLSQIANQGTSDPSIWAERYDASCPSEFYRGYASLLAKVNNEFNSNPDISGLRHLVEAIHPVIQALPMDERRNGANFALINVAGYAQAGSVQQISATLNAELICIARCFLQNQSHGI